MVCLFYSIVAIVAVMYCLFDVNYFIRIIFTIIWRKFIPRKRKKLNDEIHTYGFCTTNDVDMFITHMNNARFLRELDFSRFDFYHRTGMYDALISKKANVLQGAATVRYRKPLPIFSFYQVTTKLIYWDAKAVYLEHKFITLSDKFVRAVVTNKQHLIMKDISVNDFIVNIDPEMKLPEPPEDLKHWINYIEASSVKLRKAE